MAFSFRLPQTFGGQILFFKWQVLYDASVVTANGFFWLDFLRGSKNM
jgi:hypothetical protein